MGKRQNCGPPPLDLLHFPFCHLLHPPPSQCLSSAPENTMLKPRELCDLDLSIRATGIQYGQRRIGESKWQATPINNDIIPWQPQKNRWTIDSKTDGIGPSSLVALETFLDLHPYQDVTLKPSSCTLRWCPKPLNTANFHTKVTPATCVRWGDGGIGQISKGSKGSKLLTILSPGKPIFTTTISSSISRKLV